MSAELVFEHSEAMYLIQNDQKVWFHIAPGSLPRGRSLTPAEILPFFRLVCGSSSGVYSHTAYIRRRTRSQWKAPHGPNRLWVARGGGHPRATAPTDALWRGSASRRGSRQTADGRALREVFAFVRVVQLYACACSNRGSGP